MTITKTHHRTTEEEGSTNKSIYDHYLSSGLNSAGNGMLNSTPRESHPTRRYNTTTNPEEYYHIKVTVEDEGGEFQHLVRKLLDIETKDVFEWIHGFRITIATCNQSPQKTMNILKYLIPIEIQDKGVNCADLDVALDAIA
ncbi:hypothetical protein PAEPH01_1401 [Pancytospora epiphaga]|nr:hypothetical protein PAEPH01_1401 [Pancytospora epiphaga]